MRVPLLGFAGLCVALLLAGCDDGFIDPFDNQGKYFSVYGYLDVLEHSHEVRVSAVTRQPALIRTPTDLQAELDAVVTSTNLRNGNTIRWHHELEEFEDGTYGHVFRASFIVQAATTYRLDVTRSDGITASAETTVPYIPDAALFERDPVVFEADSIPITQHIKIPRVPSPWDIQVIYRWSAGTINTIMYAPYGRQGAQTEDGGWEVTVGIQDDQPLVRENIQLNIDQGRISPVDAVVLHTMGLRIRLLDDKWDPPEAVFDENTLILPQSLSNVENGYGFFGSVGIYVQEWNVCEFSGPLGYAFAEPGC